MNKKIITKPLEPRILGDQLTVMFRNEFVHGTRFYIRYICYLQNSRAITIFAAT